MQFVKMKPKGVVKMINSINTMEVKMIYLKKFFQTASLLVLLFGLFACQEKDNIVNPDSNSSFEKLVLSDDDILSFEPNYNEEEAMSFLGKLSKTVFPVKVGQNMKLVSRTLEVDSSSETAIGTLTEVFDGKLIIAASFTEPTMPRNLANVDTVITKTFSTTITRKIKFEKTVSANAKRNWRITAVSLPEGGTLNPGVEITRMTVTLPNGDNIDVTNPNDYWLERFPGIRHQIPVINRGQGVKLTVHVKSLYDGEDFISLTFGAVRGQGHHRTKAKFDLISSEFDGAYYNKVYEQTWNEVMQPMGHKHAIVNALPAASLNDSDAPVEENSWGMPYIIK